MGPPATSRGRPGVQTRNVTRPWDGGSRAHAETSAPPWRCRPRSPPGCVGPRGQPDRRQSPGEWERLARGRADLLGVPCLALAWGPLKRCPVLAKGLLSRINSPDRSAHPGRQIGAAGCRSGESETRLGVPRRPSLVTGTAPARRPLGMFVILVQGWISVLMWRKRFQ